MIRIGIAVVSHISRRDMAFELSDQVGANALFEDSTGIGCEANHRRAWDRHNEHRQSMDWAVVLEDDAIPVPRFTEQLRAALDIAPTPIVSLYLGTSRPPAWQTRILDAAVAANKADASWIIGPQLLHAVGVAIHSDYIPALCDWLPATKCPVDQAIAAWAVTQQQQVAYTWPSLVDHADDDTIATHRDGHTRTEPRKAWRTGTRTTWTTRTVHM